MVARKCNGRALGCILTLDPSLLPAVREWLDYGKLHGFGQWRNSGKGRFEWEEM